MNVRLAAASDIGWIAELAESRLFTAKWSREALAAELARPDSLFLAVDDAAARGYALARLFEDEARLVDIASAEDGKGCGRTLFEALRVAARDRECRRITLDVSVANARALAFYEKAGAKVVGRRKKFYNDGSDALLMDRNLA